MVKNRGPSVPQSPSLNAYIVQKLVKDDDGDFLSLTAELDVGSKDEKQLKNLLQSTIPRLFAYPNLPESVIKPLVSLIKSLREGKKDQKRLLRQLFSMIQMLLGTGQAGSTSAGESGEMVNATAVSKAVLKDSWAVFAKPSGDLAQQRVALRVMASIVRVMRQRNYEDKRTYSDHLAQTLSTILNKDFQVNSEPKTRRLFKSTTQKFIEASKGLHYLQTGALSAARVAMSPGGKQRLAAKGFAMLDSENPLTVRHALALAAEVADKNVEDYKKGVGPHLEASYKNYADQGYLYPTSETSAGKTSTAPNGEIGPLNLSDSFSRVYLARGCGAVVHDAGPQKSKGTVYWKALVLLACNDPSDLVFNEAIKVMMGVHTPKVMDLTIGGRQRKEFRVDEAAERVERVMRWNAWGTVVKEAPCPKPGENADLTESILSRIVDRIRRATSMGSQPVSCGACRSAVEIARARAYATSSTQKNSHKVNKASEIMDSLEEDLMVLATSSWHYTAAQQSIALHALIWLHGSDGGSLTPPVLSSILSHGNMWSQDILAELLQNLFQRLVVEPDMATYVLDSVNAIVAGNPNKIRPVEIVDFWSQAFERANKTMVLRAALQFLEAPLPPRVFSGTGMDPVLLTNATEAATSWRKLQRIATWWLGEASNFICDEVLGEEFMPILSNAYGMDASSIIATESMRNPLLTTTISHLQHSLLTAQWGVRTAAAKSLTKIALLSGEPFRIQIYKIFKEALSGAREEAGMDPFGLIVVLQPVVDLLDEMYSGQAVVEECLKKWGGSLIEWPPEAVESLEHRHRQLFAKSQKFAKIDDEAPYYPLGMKSGKLLLREEIVMDLNQGSQEIEGTWSEKLDNTGNSKTPLVLDGDDDDSSLSGSDQPHSVSLRMGAGVSLRHFAAETPPRQPTPPPLGNDSFTGFKVETHVWDPVQEDSEGSGSPDGHLLSSTTEGGGIGDWGNYDEQPVLGSTPSAITSVPSAPIDHEQDFEIQPEADQEPESHDKPQIEAPIHAEGSGVSIPFSESDAIQAFEPRDASVMYEFVAELDGELTVTAGDVIQILEEREGGWYWVRLGEKEGLVPCAYVAEPDM